MSRGKRGPVRPQAPFLDQQDLVAIDGDPDGFVGDNRKRACGLLEGVLEKAEVGQQRSGTNY